VTKGGTQKFPQKLRLLKHTNMTIHWKALGQNFLMVPFFSKKQLRQWSTGFPTSFRLVHDKKSQPVDQISIHDSFATISNMSWSRLCGRQFGQSTSRMPSYDFYAVRRHHMILSQNLLMTSKQSRLCWRHIFSVDHLQRHVITSRSRGSETFCEVRKSETKKKI
jgi:hypothetical protein